MHKIIFIALTVFLLGGCIANPAVPAPVNTPLMLTALHESTATPGAAWKLVWADEFDQPNGAGVDGSKWNAVTGAGGWGNAEWQYYTDRADNVYHEDGCLVIRTLRENYEGSHYTSARVMTKGKAEFRYGRFEMRARLPVGQAIWPAFWMLPADDTYGGWPNSGEIDIMELIGQEPGKVYGTLHFGSPHRQSGGNYLLKNGETFADDFHIFAVEWVPDEIRWYVDGKEYANTDDWFTTSGNGMFPAPFDQKFYLLLNTAVGGSWPGDPGANTPQEAKYIIDYVRVYEKQK